jgi:hypothetical protein
MIETRQRSNDAILLFACTTEMRLHYCEYFPQYDCHMGHMRLAHKIFPEMSTYALQVDQRQ